MNQEIIAMLKLDMMGEHQAIIQYLAHAYAMGEVPLAFEVEAISRDEMRHLDWLADVVVGLGGEPAMERAQVDSSPGTVSEQMLKDVEAERVAIGQYRQHLESIDDPHVRLVLTRILHDELVHRGQFAKFSAEAQSEGLQNVPAVEPATETGRRVGDILNQGIRHEYTVTLQYLYHGFLAKDKDLAEEMQNVAINEMQHIGWLAEALVGEGGEPDLSHTDLALTADPEKMLKADIAAEREVTHDYTGQLTELTDPKLQELVGRIRDHEIYHDAVFGELLAEVEGEEEAQREGEGGALKECDAPRQDVAPHESEAPEQGASQRPPPAPTIPSVGSLIGQK